MKNSRFIFTIALFFIQIPLFAQLQQTRSIAQRSMDSRSLASSYEAEISQKEKLLAQQVYRYNHSSTADKAQLKKQVEQSLFTLFDLDIQKKEANVRAIEEQLSQLRNREEYAHKAEDIRRVEQNLSEIRKDIATRKQNRNKIVQKRLIELLGK
ncbi:MAG: hypothetical protein D6730_19920 [Bacteroidetes bacterium]|nr:MAG: hypothetical protein D6730_19920 [Bacteroidota bacterium]